MFKTSNRTKHGCVYIYLRFRGVECESNCILGFFKCPTKPFELVLRANSIVLDPKLRRLHVAENRYNPFLGLHKQGEFMETEVRFAVLRRKYGDPKLAFSNCGVNLVKQPVPGLHVLAVQKGTQVEPAGEVVVQ